MPDTILNKIHVCSSSWQTSEIGTTVTPTLQMWKLRLHKAESLIHTTSQQKRWDLNPVIPAPESMFSATVLYFGQWQRPYLQGFGKPLRLTYMTLLRGEHYPWLFFGPMLMTCEHLVALAGAVGTLASPLVSLELTHREWECPSAQGHSLSERSLATKHGRPEVLWCSLPRSTPQPTRPVSW